MINSENSTVKKILVLAALAGLVLWGLKLYVDTQKADLHAVLSTDIEEQQIRVAKLARGIASDSADSVTNELVTDCVIEDRIRFDELLSNLSQLNKIELVETRTLFDICGSFYEDRRAIMTARLTREVEVLNEYIELIKHIDSNTDSLDQELVDWQRLSELEVKISKLMSELVVVQDKIIDQLINGESINSESIKASLEEAQTAKETVFILSSEASELREKLSGNL